MSHTQNRNETLGEDCLLAEVWKSRKAAVPVWVALTVIAEIKGRNRFAVRRSTLARCCGIARMPTISEALAALEDCGIIERTVKRCRRPDGTLFHRLRVRLLHRITDGVPGDEDTADVLGDQDTKIVSISGYKKPGTDQTRRRGTKTVSTGRKRNRKSTGNRVTKTVTHPHRGMMRAASSKTPHRTHADPPAGSLRCAEAPRPLPASAACQDFPVKWRAMRDDMVEAVRQVCRDVGCEPSEFMQEDSTFLSIADDSDKAAPYVIVSSIRNEENAEIEFVTQNADDCEYQPWTGTAEQVEAIKKMLTARKGGA